MQKEQEPLLKRVKRYIDSTNLTLSKNRLKVAGNYKAVDGIRCVEVISEDGFIYSRRIELICEYTGTSLYRVCAHKGCVSLLLKDNENE